MIEFELKGHKGFSIAARSWVPKGEIRALVQVVHGMVEHCARYSPLAEFLNEKGIALYAHDQRGHGKSASDSDYGHMGDSDTSVPSVRPHARWRESKENVLANGARAIFCRPSVLARLTKSLNPCAPKWTGFRATKKKSTNI